jgi:tripartite-type tricarboxylate transporter receptor subunit TctC
VNKLSLLFSTVLLCLAGLTLTAAAQAQDFPNKPITIVAPFAAGGTTDIIARSLADKMRGPLKQSVLVENRPGAASLLALNYVRSKPADGYTMVMMSTTITTLPSLNANANYSIAKDFTSIAGIGRSTMMLVVNKESGVDSVAGLIAYAKANPGKLNWGVASNLGFDHLAAERFMAQAGVKFDIIGYQGDAPMRTDLVANRVQISIGGPGIFAPQIAAGALRPLAITSATRWPDLPNIPTLAEAGVKDVVVEPWFGAFGPAGVPPEVVSLLNREFNAAIQSQDVVARLASIGMVPMVMTVAQITELATTSEQTWARAIKAMGIKPQ